MPAATDLEQATFEQGPIRPPSEATSLLLRVSRNCPWNKCTFCPVYKRRKFSVRPAEEVLADIGAMAALAESVREISWRMGCGGEVTREVASQVLAQPRASAHAKTVAAWLYHGGKTVFLQDANALLSRHELLLAALKRLRETFPTVERVTTYARGHTLARKTVEQLAELREAGLDRVHVGMETGHDPLLQAVRKGVTAQDLVEGGRRARQAGLDLCLYVMPGLGGRAMTEGHARDSAAVIRAVDPQNVRLRSLVVSPGTPLGEELARGEIELLNEEEVVEEIDRLLEGLDGCSGALVSDHDLNLLMEIEGSLATDRERLRAIARAFLELDDDERLLFIVARRTRLMLRLEDLADPVARAQATEVSRLLAAQHGGDVRAAVSALRERMV